jgi:small-conductance mechanosensitive channel
MTFSRPCTGWIAAALCWLGASFMGLTSPLAAQTADRTPADPASPIALAQAPSPASQQGIADGAGSGAPPEVDAFIEQRLSAIFSQVDGLEGVETRVRAGVVTLSGEVANEPQASDAIALAQSIEDVVLVRDKITRSRDLEGNVSPVIEQFRDDLDGLIAALPLAGFAMLVFLAIALAGHLLASWGRFWQRILPNIFLAELVAQAVRILGIVIGLVVGLTLIGANALMGTILGGAGIIGIAIGFAVRDTLENYVSSIMLSLRQPFRADDHVLINEHEGRVVRLTSRATILMTLDGNHLRIPNSTVFKGIILNYTRNPQRRFDFALGIDAEDDPAQGMQTGLGALGELPFLLADPAPFAAIEEVGDSNIVLRFFAWIDQREADYLKSRSLAIGAAKDRLESCGFTLPEPIYRVRFDRAGALSLPATGDEEGAAREDDAKPAQGRAAAQDKSSALDPDTKPETHLIEQAARERSDAPERDLLDPKRPIE